MVSGKDKSANLNRIKLPVSCGWCMTGHCADCLPELTFESTVWLCGCKKCKGGDGEDSGAGEVRDSGDSLSSSDGDGG